MERLTEKKGNEYDFKCGANHFDYCGGREEIINKLGQLEDIEEELGCPLEIITGIMLRKINEIYVNYGDGGYNSPYEDICKASVDGLYDDENYLSYNSNWVIETNLCPVPLKDYKTAWWLKEDRSE